MLLLTPVTSSHPLSYLYSYFIILLKYTISTNKPTKQMKLKTIYILVAKWFYMLNEYTVNIASTVFNKLKLVNIFCTYR